MGGVGNAAGGVPDGVAQGTRGAGFLAEVAVGAGSVGKAIYSFNRLYSFYSIYSIYRFVYHYLPKMHHATEGVVEELVVAADEAEPCLHRPTALQERR